MQTRSACEAEVASKAAVTPSPPRKKAKTQNLSRCNIECEFSFLEKDSVRDQMRSIVLSRLNSSKYVDSDQVDTNTLGGWSLIDGLTHCAVASNGILLPLIKEHGPPQFYIEHIQKKIIVGSDKFQSFRSLCRIVSGQQLAGSAAKTIWRRLLNVVDATEEKNASNLTPDRILAIVKNGDVEADLRAPAGLSNAKCNCIVAIAESFREGSLSDNFLLGGESTDEDVRSRLLGIKGLGPWSVDMFLLFQCYRPNILPTGDLAFRNGTSNLWSVKGRGKGGQLCQKKDDRTMKDLHAPFAPFRSISSYYMYKISGMK
ncbi:hypothetical protein ACHAXR_007156 [Thalassiosira sp. AJA248-18]